jgi:hypothetical protein
MAINTLNKTIFFHPHLPTPTAALLSTPPAAGCMKTTAAAAVRTASDGAG